MAIEETLKNTFKLSLYEAKLYLALLQGEMNPKEAASASEVPLPRVYDTLKTLEAKGFVERTEEGFRAAPPEVALKGRITQFRFAFEEDMKEREKALEGAIRQLKGIYRGGERSNQVLMLHGINSMANKFLEIINGSKDVYMTVNRALEVKDIFLAFLERSENRHIKIRLMIPDGVDIPEEDRDRAKEMGMEMRHYENPVFDMLVADRRDVLIGVPDPLSDEVYHSIGIWIRNPSFAAPIQDSLEALWEGSL
jgi:sugar-specific transcriptional regulator TrmB